MLVEVVGKRLVAEVIDDLAQGQKRIGIFADEPIVTFEVDTIVAQFFHVKT